MFHFSVRLKISQRIHQSEALRIPMICSLLRTWVFNELKHECHENICICGQSNDISLHPHTFYRTLLFPQPPFPPWVYSQGPRFVLDQTWLSTDQVPLFFLPFLRAFWQLWIPGPLNCTVSMLLAARSQQVWRKGLVSHTCYNLALHRNSLEILSLSLIYREPDTFFLLFSNRW